MPSNLEREAIHKVLFLFSLQQMDILDKDPGNPKFGGERISFSKLNELNGHGGLRILLGQNLLIKNSKNLLTN